MIITIVVIKGEIKKKQKQKHPTSPTPTTIVAMSVTQLPAAAAQKKKKKSSRKARARANWIAHWKKQYSKDQLTESNMEICNNVCHQFKKVPLSQRAQLLSKAITKIIKGCCVKHKLKEVNVFIQERIDKAVRKWIRERTRLRVRAAKIGTKSYTARWVFYRQNKEKVKKRAAELQKELPDSWEIGITSKALTELYQSLPKEEVDRLQTVANKWNAMGPGDEVQLE